MNMQSFPKNFCEKATIACGKGKPDKTFCIDCMYHERKSFEENYERFEKKNNLKFLQEITIVFSKQRKEA